MKTQNIATEKLLFALAVGGFAIGTTEFATMSVLPFMARGLAVSEPTAGHLISAYAAGVVVGAPLIAVFGAHFGRRSLLLALMSLFAAAHALTAFATDYVTMLVLRFVSGLPHGAYFGIAALVAASLVDPAKRAQAVGLVLSGLTVATIVGVPLTGWLAQALGWRIVFGAVAVLAALNVALVARYLPKSYRVGGNTRAVQELAALANRQIWLTVAIGAIGFGGMFAVYTYMANTLTEVTGVSEVWVPPVLSLFGVGMTLGNLIVPHLIGVHTMKGICALLLWNASMLALFPFAAAHLVWLCVSVVLIGISGAIGTVLQVRLMDVAKDAQTLGAALNHSAFNIANALGPLLGGMAINAGFGWTSTGWVGSLLSLAGLPVWLAACRDARRRSFTTD